MALLENGRPVADGWTFVPDDQPLPADGPVIVTLARLRAEIDSLSGRPLGVRLASAELADGVAAYLDDLALIAVEFPKFRDGRGFSTARELRERYGFRGVIRAVGHTIPDQYRFLLRVGFTQVEVPDDRELSAWEAALAEITIAYQPALDAAPVASLLRRRFGSIGPSPLVGEGGAADELSPSAPSPQRGEGWGEGAVGVSPGAGVRAEEPPHPASPRGGEEVHRASLARSAAE